MTAGRAAAFLDRDGTIVHDAEYLRDPDDVRLLPGAAEAIARLNRRGVPVVVVTNQSGIARGLLTRADYDAVRGRFEALLAAAGAGVDDTFMCPHHPEFTGPCECRKPGTRLYREAAALHGLDLAASTYVGDRWRDVAPALAFGGRGILVAGPCTPSEELHLAAGRFEVVASLGDAVDVILESAAGPAAPDAGGRKRASRS